MEQDKYLSVIALTKYIERKFDADPYLKHVYVKGEISNLKKPASGHIYFTVKDDLAMIRCVMFAKSVAKLGFDPEDGMNIRLQGRVNVFTKAGRYQFYAEEMEPDGVGALYVKLEQLKNKLTEEGLFADSHKKPLPLFPAKVAVVTSRTGAAIRDVITTIQRRMPTTQILVYPTVVQGDHAGKTIVANIERINQRNDIDVIITGRGGGSLEELWAFNEEPVVRAVYHSDIPIISAVGHETDFALTDFAADVRAATPTAAAELAVPDQRDLKERLLERHYRLVNQMNRVVERKEVQMKRLQDRLKLLTPKRQMEQQAEKIDYFSERLVRALRTQVTQKRTDWQQLAYRIKHVELAKDIRTERERLELREQSLKRALRTQIDRKRESFFRHVQALEHLSPLALIKRGYALPYKEGQVIRSAKELTVGDSFLLKLQDGQIKAEVTAKEED